MWHPNETFDNRFILLGLAEIPHQQALCVLILLNIYLLTLAGNILLITVVRINLNLQTPMYFFLTNLSVIDIGFSSTIVPKLLIITLAQDKSISFLGCACQMFFHIGLGSTECMILAVMAYDRYAAICKPLHYNSIMNKNFCICMASGSWIISFINSGFHVSLTFKLPFCKNRNINHFLCELPPILRLSCKDPWLNEIIVYAMASTYTICSFFLILISYVHIISTIVRIHSTKGRRKAFSTCTSHFSVVSVYYGTIMFMYLRPHSANSPNIDKAVSIIYTAVTPVLNPIIYSIRNKEVKLAIRKKVLVPIYKGSN
ncbi:hypothetical protein GDO86_016568 [Hymenochirus boettgeri]|uniref:Olfactory receptor n=1 Tax=Hymenochirus boettgeri TaxID=247094 RepID=A0A8T2JXG4_9PIPI|nr:hypothetical protein GDO86_016568 [Hymenochirus boettgeri]